MMLASVTPFGPRRRTPGMSTDSQPSLVISVTNCAVLAVRLDRASTGRKPGADPRTASRMSTRSGVARSPCSIRAVLVQAEDPTRSGAAAAQHRAGQVERVEFGQAPLRAQGTEVAAPQELKADSRPRSSRTSSAGMRGGTSRRCRCRRWSCAAMAASSMCHGQPKCAATRSACGQNTTASSLIGRVVEPYAPPAGLACADAAGPGMEQGQQVATTRGEDRLVGGIVRGERLSEG